MSSALDGHNSRTCTKPATVTAVNDRHNAAVMSVIKDYVKDEVEWYGAHVGFLLCVTVS